MARGSKPSKLTCPCAELVKDLDTYDKVRKERALMRAHPVFDVKDKWRGASNLFNDVLRAQDTHNCYAARKSFVLYQEVRKKEVELDESFAKLSLEQQGKQ